MAQLPSVVLKVADLDRALDFYRTILGFSLGPHKAGVGIAQVISPTGHALLLATEDVEDVSEWVAPHVDSPRPGERVNLDGGTAEYRAQLEQRGARGLEWEEREWGATTILVPDPDGYILAFWGGRSISDEELFYWYRLAPDRLRAAMNGLNDEDLDRRTTPDSWSIRQLVLHIVDSDATSLGRVKYALAEPGRLYHPNPYDPDRWAEGLDYAARPIGPEVALFVAIREHIGGLLKWLPDALQRTTQSPSGGALPVRPSIEALTVHTLHHIEEILEIRRQHGL